MPRSPRNDALRGRIERGIAVVAPLLDLLLLAGDRVSRLLGDADPVQISPTVRRDGGQAARRVRPRADDAR